MDGAGSWDALEWTKTEPVARLVSHGMNKFLLEAEEVIVEGFGVVLVNTDEADTLWLPISVCSLWYDLVLVAERGIQKDYCTWHIPLATLERFNKQAIRVSSGPRQSEKTTSHRLLHVIELMKVKQLRNSAMNYTAHICRENLAIKRAIQALGCKVQFSSNGDCTLSIASLEREVRQRAIRSSLKESDGSEKLTETSSDLSESGSIMDDRDPAIDFFKQACESLCPFRTPEGCRWPDAGCAQLGSQFVGLKANFVALDHLSIYDRYFDSES